MADAIFDAISSKGVGTFFYQRLSFKRDLLRRAHLDLYGRALVRIYLLRRVSFDREYPRLELLSGRDRLGNIVVPLDGMSIEEVPDDFDFMGSAGWAWTDCPGEADRITALAMDALAAARIRHHLRRAKG